MFFKMNCKDLVVVQPFVRRKAGYLVQFVLFEGGTCSCQQEISQFLDIYAALKFDINESIVSIGSENCS